MADYTCVAVNAGGVMEENISLTFEEPEPVRKVYKGDILGCVITKQEVPRTQ